MSVYDTDVLLYSTVGPPVTAATLRRCGAGGSELELVQVATALAKRGHRVTLALDLDDEDCGMDDGVIYTSHKHLPRRVKALYLQRYTLPPPGRQVLADRTVVRCNDHCDARDYDALARLLAHDGGILVCNTKWQTTLYPFAKHKAVIAPIVEAPPIVEKKLGQFVYASAARKGLKDTMRYWAFFMSQLDERHPGARAKLGLSLAVAVPEFSGGLPDMPEEAEGYGIHTVETPTIESYRRLVAESEGLFYVARFAEVFCLHPDSRISVPGNHRGGKPTVRIADLVGKSGFPVYAWDEAESRFRIATCNRVWQTKIASEMVEVVLDEGGPLRVTPEHLVMTWNREWVHAGDLKPGTRLLALNYRYNVAVQDGDGRWANEHRLVGEWMRGRPLDSNEHVDHLDAERLDNSPEMLQVLSMADHFRKTFCGRDIRSDANNLRRYWDALASLPFAQRAAVLSIQANKRAATRARKILTDPAYAAQIRHGRQKAANASFETRRTRSAARFATVVELAAKGVAVAEIADRVGSTAKYVREMLRAVRTHGGIESALEARRARNHKVVEVRRIPGGPVFDMEVEGCHTFVADGIVVHNCCLAVLAEMAGTRPHILCLRGIGGIREALTNSRLVTSDPETFGRDFLLALDEPEGNWCAPREQLADRSPDTIAKQWEEVLGL